jgi:hypothetical protein
MIKYGFKCLENTIVTYLALVEPAARGEFVEDLFELEPSFRGDAGFVEGAPNTALKSNLGIADAGAIGGLSSCIDMPMR